MNRRPPSQHESLDDEERELARVVRALPGGEPPAALDALILKAATNAVASSASPKKSPWTKSLLGTSVLWMGTAAASILTVGVGWQVFQSMRAPIYELPADENVSFAQEIDSLHKDQSLIIDVIPLREPAPTSPPPPEAFADADQLSDDAAASITNAEKPRAAAPETRRKEMPQRQEMADAMAAKSVMEEADRRRDQASESGLLGQAAAPPPPPAPAMAAAPMAAASDSASKEISEVNVVGSKLRRTIEAEGKQSARTSARAENVSKPITDIEVDATLPPALWLDAINVRVKNNDTEGAKASIKRFKETHPKFRIPEELKFLLR